MYIHALRIKLYAYALKVKAAIISWLEKPFSDSKLPIIKLNEHRNGAAHWIDL